MAFGPITLLPKPPQPPKPTPPPAKPAAPKPVGYSNTSTFEAKPSATTEVATNPPTAQETAAVQQLPPTEQTNYWNTRAEMNGDPAGQKALADRVCAAVSSGKVDQFDQVLDAVRPLVGSDTTPSGAKSSVVVSQIFQTIDDPSSIHQGGDDFNCGTVGIVVQLAARDPAAFAGFVSSMAMGKQVTVNGVTYDPPGKVDFQTGSDASSPIIQLLTPTFQAQLASSPEMKARYPNLTFDKDQGVLSYTDASTGDEVVCPMTAAMVAQTESNLTGSPMNVEGIDDADPGSANQLVSTATQQVQNGEHPTVIMHNYVNENGHAVDQKHFQVVKDIKDGTVYFEDGSSMSVGAFKGSVDVIIFNPRYSRVPANDTAPAFGDQDGGHFKPNTNGSTPTISSAY